ncbi:MAG: Ig-like domain-containing protein [Lentimicrobiaceae bacterium]|nr:Ig-like domain-containing protein [Lentimicrobiaceae bacterium]
MTFRISLSPFSLLLFSLLLLAGCAKIVLPSGGPKDVTPPKVVAEKPENASTNFQGKIIKITFDEYVTLNNPTENVIFSPPLNERIDYSTKGKSVLVKMQDTLRQNTTYNILFSNCIQDFNEGNKLNSYDYAFSTGDSIDMHKLFGVVVNAETNQPEAGCFVMLYEQDVDSLPLTVRPNYLTKTNEQGRFIFNHLKPESYKVFALKDINSNLIYDLPNEFIAFSDDMFQAKYYATDSLFRADTAFITLRMFQEADTMQVLAPCTSPQTGIYHFPYKLPVYSFDIQIEGDTIVDFFSKINTTKDTISVYLKTFFKESAMVFIQTDDIRIDTVDLLPYKNSQQTGRTRKLTTPILNIDLTNKDDLYLPASLNFSYPVQPADSVQMFVIAVIKGEKDTTAIYVSVPDTFVMQLPVPFVFEPKINYTIMLADSSFYGYDGTTNDTLVASFSKKTEKDYGNLIIHYKTDDKNGADFIVELLSSNQKVVCKDIISSSKTIEYKHLLPGSYRIRVIEDINKNERWDTGNYRKKIQPEKIFYIDKEITIRGFWDIEEDVELRAP